MPTPEVTLMECRRLQAALDKEVQEHSKTKMDLSSVQAALAASISQGDSDRAKSAGTGSGSGPGTQMHQKRELLALRETNIDQAEQIQVSVILPNAIVDDKLQSLNKVVFIYVCFYMAQRCVQRVYPIYLSLVCKCCHRTKVSYLIVQ